MISYTTTYREREIGGGGGGSRLTRESRGGGGGGECQVSRGWRGLGERKRERAREGRREGG